MNINYSKKTTIMSVCAALCIVLPQTLRVIPNADIAYKAIQMPVLLCGLLCGSGGGLLCAVAGGCISVFISGIPAVPMFPVILAELVLMGFFSGFFAAVFKANRGGTALLCSIALAVLIGRGFGGAAAAVLYSPGREAMVLWIWSYIIAGLPSFIVQLVLLPMIIRALESCGYIKGSRELEAQTRGGTKDADFQKESDSAGKPESAHLKATEKNTGGAE